MSGDAVISRLEARITGYESRRALVALSGGVDSSVVLALAARALGCSDVIGVTAVSPSYPAGELADAQAVAGSIGVEHRMVATGEIGKEAYTRNDTQRCFHCKAELFASMARLAREAGIEQAILLAGANADDSADFRPGMRAGVLFGVRDPLLEEGVGKATVRTIAHRLELSVAEKPAMACLSSRVAYGHRITPALLHRIDEAERAVRSLGFASVRVRHFGDAATIEVPLEEVARLTSHKAIGGIVVALRRAGWQSVTVDPQGYRSGSMNELLPAGEASPAAVHPPRPRSQ